LCEEQCDEPNRADKLFEREHFIDEKYLMMKRREEKEKEKVREEMRKRE
jgi:hypothetical protein